LNELNLCLKVSSSRGAHFGDASKLVKQCGDIFFHRQFFCWHEVFLFMILRFRPLLILVLTRVQNTRVQRILIREKSLVCSLFDLSIHFFEKYDYAERHRHGD
jgi:hypothetical protein